MATTTTTIARSILALLTAVAWHPLSAQSRQAQAGAELARTKGETAVKTCSLLTNAEIRGVTGRKNSWDLTDEPYEAGSVCDYGGGVVTIRIYSGPRAEESIDWTLKNYKVANMKKNPIAGFGSGAYVMYFVPDNTYQDTAAILVARAGARMFMISLAAPDGKTAESVQPQLVTLAKTVSERLSRM
jgi:hypothetical protein